MCWGHDWNYYGTKSKWAFKGGADIWLYPERKCVKCGRLEQLESVTALRTQVELSKTWVHIYKTKYETDQLLDAVRKLYYAGTWSCADIGWLEAKRMWEAVRDAAGFEPGGTSDTG